MHPNSDPAIADFWLIRHAPSLDGGAMAGRRDVDADCNNDAAFDAMRAKVALGPQDRLWASPAKRCQQTAAALWRQAPQTCPPLQEQDFGTWEGMPYSDLPDLGPLGRAELAAFAPLGGESYLQLYGRVWPALQGMGAGKAVVVAHAGVIRAALGHALGAAHMGLGFSIAPLSLTRISWNMDSGDWAVHFVNWTAQ